mgnify:CR=1 FL=1
MKEKEQSSIEWLFEQLPDHLRLSRNGFEILQQAKQLHKKEIIEAHLDGQYCNVKGEESERYGEKYKKKKYSTE